MSSLAAAIAAVRTEILKDFPGGQRVPDRAQDRRRDYDSRFLARHSYRKTLVPGMLEHVLLADRRQRTYDKDAFERLLSFHGPPALALACTFVVAGRHARPGAQGFSS